MATIASEEIEYFKRFAKVYLLWSHSNFDRIVKDAVRRQELIKIAEDEARKREEYENSLMGKLFKITKEQANAYANILMKDNLFIQGSQWSKEDKVKLGTTLRIKLPSSYIHPHKAPSSFWQKLLTGTKRLFRS